MKNLLAAGAILALAGPAPADDLKPGHVFFQLSGTPLALTNSDPKNTVAKTYRLPADQMRGSVVVISADIKAEGISPKPQPWNGVKLMIRVEANGQTDWPQADIPVGTFDWQHFSTRLTIPTNVTAVTLMVGLEKVSGVAVFDRVKVSLRRVTHSTSAAAPAQPIFRGHGLARLRGAMVSPRMAESDFAVLADEWHANLIRWQLIRSAQEAESVSYDKWLDQMLEKTDRVLEWAKQCGVKVVLDLHSPPGGKVCSGGYVAAMGEFFTRPEAQHHFVEVWKKMARRYKGNNVIWGFDLVNEPVDENTSDDCLEWQELALAAGSAIREIDAGRVLIVEPPHWGGPAGWTGFNPIPLPRVVYSFHLYEPGAFTHQRVFDKRQKSVAYPGNIQGQTWNRQRLLAAVKPAIDFAQRYRVHMYVGEFSAIRWAPGADQYLADAISIFEEQGWDWSYHAFREWSGWSLEHGPDEEALHPSAGPTARFQVVESWLQRNQSKDNH